MEDDSNVTDNFCTNCKVNLAEGQAHTEACKFLQKAELEKKKIQEKADKVIEKAKLELENKLANQKEQITKEAREQLLAEIKEEQKKKKELLQQKDDETKLKFIEKIIEFTPTDDENKINLDDLKKLSLKELMKFYRKIIKIQVAESKKYYEIKCPKCFEELGRTLSHDDAVKVLKNHKKDCPKMKNNNLGKWLLVGFAISLIAGSITFLHSNPHLLKKGKSEEDE